MHVKSLQWDGDAVHQHNSDNTLLFLEVAEVPVLLDPVLVAFHPVRWDEVHRVEQPIDRREYSVHQELRTVKEGAYRDGSDGGRTKNKMRFL